MDVRRDVIDRLEAAGIGYFVTGSEAMAILGLAYRSTNDMPRLDLAYLRAHADTLGLRELVEEVLGDGR